MSVYTNPIDALRDAAKLWRHLANAPANTSKSMAARELGLDNFEEVENACPMCDYDTHVLYEISSTKRSAHNNVRSCSHCLVWVDPAITGACTNRHTNPDSGQLPGAFTRWGANRSLRAIEAKVIADEAEENLNFLLSIGYKGSNDEA